jgi:polar amino acid transport system substrate-binding protein
MIPNRRRRRVAIALGIASATVLTACIPMQVDTDEAGAGTGGLPATIAKSGVLRVGMSPDFPPMEYKDDQTDQTVGMDVDLANAVAEELGVRVERVESPFDQLLNSVATGRVDVVMSGISDTTERQKTVSFVDYFMSQGRFYTVRPKAGGYTEQTSVCGKSVAVSSKTDYYDQIATLSETVCQSAGLPEIRRLGTDSGAAARLQIEQGRADLAVQGGENLAYLEKTEPGKYVRVLDPLPGTPFGAVVAKDDTALAEALKGAFEKLQADGEYDEILGHWGLDYGKMAPVINGVK